MQARLIEKVSLLQAIINFSCNTTVLCPTTLKGNSKTESETDKTEYFLSYLAQLHDLLNVEKKKTFVDHHLL